MAFSPGGATPATAGADQTVILWDMADRQAPQQVGRPLGGHENPVARVAFSPDGATPAAAGGRQVSLWDPARLNALRANPLERARRAVGTGLSREDWDRLVPGVPYEQTRPR